jgi:integrase
MATKTRNRGQVSPKGKDKWLVRIFLGRGDDGKKQYFSKVVAGNKSKAHTFLTAKLREMDTGTFADTTTQTLDQHLDEWLSMIRARVAPQTYNSYVSTAKNHLRPKLGRSKLIDIKTRDVQKVYAEMQEAGLSPRTVHYAHAVLSMALRKAVELGLIIREPCKFAELPKQARKETKVLDREQVVRFIQASQEDRYGIIFEVALMTGMRPEEYLGLQWKDIDLERGSVSVRRALVWRKGGGFDLGEPKTRGSRRNVPLSESLIAKLRTHRSRQLESRLKLGAAYSQLDLVFATDIGTPIHYRNLTNRHYVKILEAAGLSDQGFVLYSLRHTCATLLLSAGENPKVVAERLGHSSVKTTLDTYSHVLPDMQENATAKLDAILYG